MISNVWLVIFTIASAESHFMSYTSAADEEASINLPKLGMVPGYNVKEYTAITDDEYRLKMFRFRGDGPITQPIPVLIMHGIFASCEDYVRMGPKRSLAYLMTDRGYDVWLGNLRGNLYSSHAKLKKTDRDFWNYSLDELGRYDVPAMIQTILRVTNSSALHYVGYSMSTTAYYIAWNKRPDVMKSVATFVALAPIVYLGPRIKALCEFAERIRLEPLFRSLNVSVLMGDPNQVRTIAGIFCNAKYINEDVCLKLIHLTTGEDFSQVEWDRLRTIARKVQPATVKQLNHYKQVALTGKLSEYDYGEKENVKRYGRRYPPAYDLGANTAPTAMFYGQNDFLAPPISVNRLSRKLRSKSKMFIMEKMLPYKLFNHLDFVYAKDIKKLLNDDIIEAIPMLMKHSNKSL